MKTENKKSDNKRQITVRANYDIRKPYVKLITDNGLKQYKTSDAISLAESDGLDLVEISFDKESKMPICKILDYGKYVYDLKKREKEQKKATRIAKGELKEIVFSIRIDENDKKIKIDHIKEFLNEKNTRVKISIRLSKREMSRTDFAKDLMREILNECNGIAKLDGTPVFQGRIMSCVLKGLN